MMTRARSLYVLLAGCLAALVGCSDVESCLEENEPGCLNSPIRSSGKPCLFDLVAVNGFCRQSGEGVEILCGRCEDGALCDEASRTCINFCDAPQVLPGSVMSPEAIFCEAIATDTMPNPPMLTFEEVCRRRCRLNCQRLSQFCPGYQCPAGSCDGADVLTRCVSDCPPVAGGNDLACLTRNCNDTRFAVCDSKLSCPNNAKPNCANITCSNTCMFSGVSVTGNGQCDDGDTLSSDSAQCAWGTDCTDCGPRAGKEVIGGFGDICQYSLNCENGTGSPDSADAWCVKQKTLSVTRCMPDCSRGQQCATGFSCHVLTFDNEEDNTSAPIVVGKYTSSACLPDTCQ